MKFNNLNKAGTHVETDTVYPVQNLSNRNNRFHVNQQTALENSMPLPLEQFAKNLARCMEAVRDNIAQFCWNEMPSQNRYFVILNSSFDRNPLAPGEYLFPDHDTPQTDARRARTAEEVVELLWRDGKIPEWIDIIPYEIKDGFLYSELHCCGRFTDRETILYHQKEGYPPFHKFGPVLPADYRSLKEDGKFDLHCYRDRKPHPKPIAEDKTPSPPQMKLTADWLAWSLQFFAGLVGGALLGFVIVTRRSMGHWLAPDQVSTFLCGIALLGAGLASYYGDRFWYSSSAYRISTIEDLKHNAATRIGSIATGLLGAILLLKIII